MNKEKVGRYLVLGVLFFLPVVFLLLLYPATHHYTPLDIVEENLLDLDNFTSNSKEKIVLENHITVLAFLGINPIEKAIVASNLKELVYDKFKGFKKFQVVVLMPKGTESAVEKLKLEISSYENLRFWSFVFAEPKHIIEIHNRLKSNKIINQDLSSNYVFIIDKDLNQRGRLDDRTDKEQQANKPIYGLYSYNCIEVAQIKNKMNDDLRVLFTEYRQKRKGKFDSVTRRADDLKTQINE